MKWDWVLWNFGLITPWLAALALGLVVVFGRSGDRRVVTVAAAGLVLMLVTAVARAGLVNTLSVLKVFASNDAFLRTQSVVDYCYWYGKAVGIGLLVLAAFVGRRVRGCGSP
jgi:hypothetical protein